MSEKIKAMFEKFDDEFLKADKALFPLDLTAFNLLNALVPSHANMVSCAEHDEIWLTVSPEELEKANMTEDTVRSLVRCGVRYDSSLDCLAMFV